MFADVNNKSTQYRLNWMEIREENDGDDGSYTLMMMMFDVTRCSAHYSEEWPRKLLTITFLYSPLISRPSPSVCTSLMVTILRLISVCTFPCPLNQESPSQSTCRRRRDRFSFVPHARCPGNLVSRVPSSLHPCSSCSLSHKSPDAASGFSADKKNSQLFFADCDLKKAAEYLGLIGQSAQLPRCPLLLQ